MDLLWAYNAGYLNGTTIPFGLFNGDRAISILAAKKQTLVINNESIHVAQMGAVATAPSLQGRGYSREVMQFALDHISNMPVFLYANDEVVDYYPKFGFRLTKESVYDIDLKPTGKQHSFRRLDLTRPDDTAQLDHALDNRVSVSRSFYIADYTGLAKWYCRILYQDKLWYEKESETLLIADMDQSVLRIYDLVTDRPNPDFLLNLAWPGAKRARCYFVPDHYHGRFEPKPDPTPDSHLYIKGDFPDRGTTKIPMLAYT